MNKKKKAIMITISIIIVLLLAIVFSSNNKNFNSNNSVENNSQIVEGPKNIVTEYTGTLPSDTGLTVSGVSKKFNQDIISQVHIYWGVKILQKQQILKIILIRILLKMVFLYQMLVDILKQTILMTL